MTKVFIRAPSPDVVTSDEPGLNTVQKWLEVEKAGRDDAETLNDLCAKYHSPWIVTWLLQTLGIVPEGKLASRGDNDAIRKLASEPILKSTNIRAPKRKKGTDRDFSGNGNLDLPDRNTRQDHQS